MKFRPEVNPTLLVNNKVPYKLQLSTVVKQFKSAKHSLRSTQLKHFYSSENSLLLYRSMVVNFIGKFVINKLKPKNRKVQNQCQDIVPTVKLTLLMLLYSVFA